MRSLPKVGGVVSGGFVFYLCLSIAAQAEDRKAGPSVEHRSLADQVEANFVDRQETRIIQCDVLRVDGTNYFVKGLDGEDVILQVDHTTVQTGNVKAGDRIEAKVNAQNHALSILPAP
ncbi:MAG: hypothetical protein ACREJN_14975 [Nitrospiraceae bacterium]